MFQRLLHKMDLSPTSAERIKVVVGTTLLLIISGIPVFTKNDRPGHDLFSQEKPEAIIVAQENLWREHQKQMKSDKD